MRKGPKCIQILWDNEKKIPFVETYKECAICAILREQTPFWGHSQRLKKLLLVLSALKILPRGHKKMQIPRGYQKKRFIL